MSAWYGDRAAWHFILRRYAPWLAGLSLLWEVAQLPLYTIWTEGTAAYKAFAVLHCTGGDVVIGVAALVIALVATRSGESSRWKLGRLAAVLVVAGVGYTIFSEWNNTILRAAWAYSPAMPLVRLGSVEVGASPLLQWIVVPPLALWLGRRGLVQA